MVGNSIIILKDLETQREICTLDEAILAIDGRLNNLNIIPIIIENENNGVLDAILRYAKIDSGLLLKTILVVSKENERMIEAFIRDNNLILCRKEIYKIIGIINAEVHSYRDLTDNGQDSMVKDFENIAVDEKALNNVLELYRRRYRENGEINEGELNDVTIHFTKRSKGFKITNFFVLDKIMTLLLDYYFQETPSFKFTRLFTQIKQDIALGLFDLFNLENTQWFTSTKNQIFKKVAAIYNLAGIDEVNEDNTKTWVSRATKKHILDR